MNVVCKTGVVFFVWLFHATTFFVIGRESTASLDNLKLPSSEVALAIFAQSEGKALHYFSQALAECGVGFCGNDSWDW